MIHVVYEYYNVRILRFTQSFNKYHVSRFNADSSFYSIFTKIEQTQINIPYLFAASNVLDSKHIDCCIICHWQQKPSRKILHKISMKHTHQQKFSGKIRYPHYWNYRNIISRYCIF